MPARRTGRFRPKTQVLALAEGEVLPSEFRIWKAGLNPTRNGYDVLFDETAASSVMAAYAEHGVDVMIDLEHLSLEDPGPGHDPDARGWCNLELRDGELWAVNVRWTDDGARRLSAKTQRYVSPAFTLDEESRPTRLFNIALVAMPATDDGMALVAARARFRVLSDGPSMQDASRAVSEALEERYPADPNEPCSGPWICDLYAETVVYEYDGKLFEAPYAFDGSTAVVGDGVEVQRVYAPVASSPSSAPPSSVPPPPGMENEMRPTLTRALAALKQARVLVKAGMSPKTVLAALADSAAGDGSGEAAGVDIAGLADFLQISINPAQDPAGFVKALMEKLDEISAALKGESPAPAPDNPGGTDAPSSDMAATKALLQLCGAKDVSEAIVTVADWRKLAVEHEREVQKVAKERKALEATKKRQLTARLVVCGGELPSTAWADEAKTEPAPHLASMTIEQLEKRVANFEAKAGVKAPLTPATQQTGDAPVTEVESAKTIRVNGVDVHLSADEVKRCTDRKADLTKYAEIKLRQGRTGAVTLEG